MSREKDEPIYVRVRDGAGQEFLCPLQALKPTQEASEEELTNCVDRATAERHPSNTRTREQD